MNALLSADERRRALLSRVNGLRAERNAVSRRVAAAVGAERLALLAMGGELAAESGVVEAELAAAEQAFAEAHRAIPNLVDPAAPVGGSDDFVVLEQVGIPREFDFTPLDHLDLGVRLGALDMARGTKVAGPRFPFLIGVGAQLQLALVNMAVAQATAAGFRLVIPPVLVRPEVMAAAGFPGTYAGDTYHLRDDDLYLAGSPETALAGFHADEILDLSAGPLRYAGWSTCFRREAGSDGRDTRGVLRVRQFDMVEMFVWCRPGEAGEEHRRLLAWQRGMLGKIEVPYRVVDTATGELGVSAARRFDCEAWIPAERAYRELTSTSNNTTFQGRRLGVRYPDGNGRPRPVATVSGTLAATRWIVAILENHQQADGSVVVPAPLRPFLGLEVLRP